MFCTLNLILAILATIWATLQRFGDSVTIFCGLYYFDDRR